MGRRNEMLAVVILEREKQKKTKQKKKHTHKQDNFFEATRWIEKK